MKQCPRTAVVDIIEGQVQPHERGTARQEELFDKDEDTCDAHTANTALIVSRGCDCLGVAVTERERKSNYVDARSFRVDGGENGNRDVQ